MVAAAVGDGDESGHLAWKRTVVAGRPALYGVAGEGLPVVFLHGWGLGQHSYKRALKRLVNMGCQVFAPAMPGFGGTPDLPRSEFSLAGYAAWVDAFLTAVGLDEPVFLVGHSFGGGVAIKTASEHMARVRSLVLANSIGGSMAGRPLWDWGIHFPREVLPSQLTRVLPVVLEDALPNLVFNPRAMWKVANLARTADLSGELEDLKARGLPVVVLWGDQDRIIPRSAFEDLCAAVGLDGDVVNGNHSWLLADPDAFGEVMTNIVDVAQVARDLERSQAQQPRSRARRLLSRLPGVG